MALFSRKPAGPFIKSTAIQMHWDTEDPFLFASHHEDDYPEGNRQQAPPLNQIAGRNLGRDYETRFGFRMYNGKVVPGFPMHAHWGYETVTLPQTGYIDHFDTLGNQGRFGFGDVQWVYASGRYGHNEMYPLADQEGRNPNDITQIFLNMPLEEKNKGSAVATVWKEDAAVVESDGVSVRVICGSYGGASARSPSPYSWSHDPAHAVRVLRVEMEPGAEFVLDPTVPGANRNLYYVSGKEAEFCGTPVRSCWRLKIDPETEVPVHNGDETSVVWILEGVPIGQRMSSFGPIFLGSDKEVREALNEVRRKEFEEWPWDLIDKTQPLGTSRFIRYSDGSEVRPPE